jgi:hypothetical protein
MPRVECGELDYLDRLEYLEAPRRKWEEISCL